MPKVDVCPRSRVAVDLLLARAFTNDGDIEDEKVHVILLPPPARVAALAPFAPPAPSFCMALSQAPILVGMNVARRRRRRRGWRKRWRSARPH